MTAHFYLVPRLRISGAISLLPHIIFVVHKDRFTITSASTRARTIDFSVQNFMKIRYMVLKFLHTETWTDEHSDMTKRISTEFYVCVTVHH